MNETAVRRLLIPITAATERVHGIDYSRRCLAAGWPVEVFLLHVIEPVDAWQVLRFLTRDEVARFQEQRATDCLTRHAAFLAADGIPFCSVVRRGALIESIVSVADELACAEIVIPAPPQSIWGGCGSLAARLARHAGGTPVTLTH